MRPLHALLLCLVAAGCQCGPDALPTPVTLRIRNTTSQAVFVDATDDTLGLRVQRHVGDAWFSFVEAPPCPCLACDVICDDACNCQDAEPIRRVQKIPAGATVERTWSGFVQVDQTASCRDPAGELQGCLEQEVPPLDETFRLQLCYATSVPGLGPNEGLTPVPGTLPEDGTVCVLQQFAVADGVVEVGPTPPPPCSRDSECASAGTVCLAGVCTNTCPAHGFPAVGGSWQVRVLEPEEQGVPGFFATSTGTGGRRIFTGTGTLTSVRYSNGTMTLQLARAAAPAGEHKAIVSIALPSEAAVTLRVGEQLAVRVVDASTSSLPENRALTLRASTGMLLLAADPGQLGAVLAAEDTQPFTVVSLPRTVGCEDTQCGKRSFLRTEFRAGAAVVALDPGESEEVVAASATWSLISLSNSAYRSTSCSLKSLMPYVVFNQRVAQGP
ncbi:hypothetical protein [Hyalangium rubrum]|uniref:Lipoprotein n=1 Tax=Hyalangium rubrum TaxID=3103134 RepID=A0ABU5HDH4_9BACT|nr:hypothetical protein [Hyalangium sp. s54d21]MDY7230878.1 hypothetical protein [Hyalangium sp. s54d21]